MIPIRLHVCDNIACNLCPQKEQASNLISLQPAGDGVPNYYEGMLPCLPQICSKLRHSARMPVFPRTKHVHVNDTEAVCNWSI